MVFADGRAPAVGAGQEQDGLLDVRGEEQEVHDLGDAGAGDVGQTGEDRTSPHLTRSHAASQRRRPTSPSVLEPKWISNHRMAGASDACPSAQVDSNDPLLVGGSTLREDLGVTAATSGRPFFAAMCLLTWIAEEAG